ncbi:hypothetical protein ACDW_45780 (plasmid) [Acidovorax sp. DW039]|uniref:conjugative transfer protein MobI(A/C) n=1 Tax=Acidovorax sp. DW039 TaxID=3095606 RepID=UPI00308B1B76|nr:hypothetical protein ACDW_45780 [Acidovorax sp. DW039]
MTALETCIMELYNQAVTAADDYMAFVDREEARATGWESRATLQLSCVPRGNHLDLKWTGVRWYGPKNNRKMARVRITTVGETMSYSKDKLTPFAKEWEIDKVMETEAKLHAIRRKAKHIVKSMTYVRNALKVYKANGGGDEDISEEDSAK